MAILLVSDLHLDASRPAVTSLFIDFLRGRARDADALYILGDLFEMWVGDDEHSELNDTVAAALLELSSVTPIYYMHGNRDFLLGDAYATQSGMTLLPDPYVADFYGVPTLLSHGDAYCLDDVAYQAFRSQVRDVAWQKQFLSQPLEARLAFAAQARAASAAHQSGLANMETITDVTPSAIDELMTSFGVSRLIHGHTHRPFVHTDRGYERIVLGDWYEQGSVLEIVPNGEFTLESLPVLPK